MNHERSFLTLKELKKKVYDIESGYISFHKPKEHLISDQFEFVIIRSYF